VNVRACVGSVFGHRDESQVMYLLEHAVGVFMEREVKKFGVTSFTCMMGLMNPRRRKE